MYKCKIRRIKEKLLFQTEDETISLNDFVVVETIVGKEVGQVVSNKQDLEKMTFEKEIKPILRKATKKIFKYSKKIKKVHLKQVKYLKN